jgi:hypothetical protein
VSRLLHRQRLDKAGHPTGYCLHCHKYVATVYRRDEECPVRLRLALDAYAAAAADAADAYAAAAAAAAEWAARRAVAEWAAAADAREARGVEVEPLPLPLPDFDAIAVARSILDGGGE